MSDPDGSNGASPPELSSRWEWRLRVYPLAVVAVLASVVLLAVATDTGTQGEDERLGGDYPAFYAAGSLAADGEWDHLYDAGAQQAAQAGLTDSEGGLLYFAYPPPVAAAYAPLATMDYRWSYLVHTVLMALALWAAVWLARPMVPLFDRYPAAAFAALLLTYPLYRAVAGGQNTALTLLLVVAAARFAGEERWVATGVAAGLLLYKPQFGAVFIAMLAVQRRWRALAATSVVAALFWVLSAALIGPDWLTEWWSRASDFARLNADLNQANLVSLPGGLGHLWGNAGEVVGWALAALTVATLVAFVWLGRDANAPAAYALTAAALVLTLPQPLFYEVGLLAFAVGMALGTKRAGPIAGVLIVATWVQPISGGLGSVPLMVLAAAAAAWSGLVLWRNGAVARSPAASLP